jgi:hypothetical protein
MIPDTLDRVTQSELQRYENNYNTLNLITTALGRNVYDKVAHLKMAHDVWLKLCNTYEGSSEIKSSRRDTYNRQFQTFSQKPGEYVTFGDDKKGKVLGTSVIKVNDCFTLNDVTLVDRLRYNLLSVSQLYDANLSVLFCKSDSHVLDPSGKCVCSISRIGNVF